MFLPSNLKERANESIGLWIPDGPINLLLLVMNDGASESVHYTCKVCGAVRDLGLNFLDVDGNQ